MGQMSSSMSASSDCLGKPKADSLLYAFMRSGSAAKTSAAKEVPTLTERGTFYADDCAVILNLCCIRRSFVLTKISLLQSANIPCSFCFMFDSSDRS
jgi:hypothetical protein